MHNIENIRKEYTLKDLDISHVHKDPLKQFSVWFDEAIKSNLEEPTAMTLATISPENKPSSRVVLLKGIEDGGFIFYTNYNSKKAKDIEQNPYVCLNFHWVELERQVRIQGKISKISEAKSTAYFKMRPRASQIGALASDQSQIINSRKELEDRFNELTAQYEGKEIPRPQHWGGYIVIPESIEFWQGRRSRLHDRILYTLLEPQKWNIERLAP
jgi:pyridoxamine 5'-phosphate oxidase